MPEASWTMLGGLNSGVVLSLIAVLWTMAWQNLQHLQLQQFLSRKLGRHARRLAALVDPYLSVTIAEYEGGRMKRSDAYEEVKAYLSGACSARQARAQHGGRRGGARRLPGRHRLVVGLLSPAPARRRQRRLVRRRAAVGAPLLPPLLPGPPPRARAGRVPPARAAAGPRRHGAGPAAEALHQHRHAPVGRGRVHAVGVVFEHPKTFATLAMDPARKKQVLDDLDMLRNERDYYARVGKACGSAGTCCTAPGTGKSAMANHLDYDIELTSVHSNTDLRRLFIETTSKSIIVIEDIDCSLDLTGARRDMKKSSSADDKDNTKAAASRPGAGGDEKNKDAAGSSKVTLSGLLNFIDGLWSACGGERVIVFTTNHVDRLDPALIRRGRMDKHIEMSYCGFDAFRFLAKTYLDVDAHRLFGAVQDLLREVDMTPADVAEYLTPKSLDDDADSCLAALVKALEDDKEKKKAGGGGGDGQDDGQDVEEDQYSSI